MTVVWVGIDEYPKYSLYPYVLLRFSVFFDVE